MADTTPAPKLPGKRGPSSPSTAPNGVVDEAAWAAAAAETGPRRCLTWSTTSPWRRRTSRRLQGRGIRPPPVRRLVIEDLRFYDARGVAGCTPRRCSGLPKKAKIMITPSCKDSHAAHLTHVTCRPTTIRSAVRDAFEIPSNSPSQSLADPRRPHSPCLLNVARPFPFIGASSHPTRWTVSLSILPVAPGRRGGGLLRRRRRSTGPAAPPWSSPRLPGELGGGEVVSEQNHLLQRWFSSQPFPGPYHAGPQTPSHPLLSARGRLAT